MVHFHFVIVYVQHDPERNTGGKFLAKFWSFHTTESTNDDNAPNSRSS